MVLNVYRNHTAYQVRDGEKVGEGGGGPGGMEMGGEGVIYPSLHCHHQNDGFCILIIVVVVVVAGNNNNRELTKRFTTYNLHSH